MNDTQYFTGKNGLKIAATVIGNPNDPHVLLSHGGGQTRHSWHNTTAYLGEHGWYAVSIDLRGHGDSDWDPDGNYSHVEFQFDVLEVARQLNKPAMIGASLGGMSSLGALGLSKDDPCGSALVLVDVAPNIEQKGADRILGFMAERAESGFASLEEVAEAVHAYNPHRPKPTDLNGLKKNVRQRADGRWYWHWDPKFMSIRPLRDGQRKAPINPEEQGRYARELTVPTLLVRGRQSDLLSEEGARAFLEMCPHAQFVDVGGAGHMVAGDRNDVFNDAIVKFLDSIR
jgi:pimeloyl-ACP methyl ester carboxylesterase